MRFDIRYSTVFTYDQLVRESQNELRACPTSDHRQQLISYRVSTAPDSRIVTFTDYWGTRVDAFGIREPHVALEVIADATVETSEAPLVTASPTRSALEQPAFRDRHHEYLEPTRHTEPGARASEMAERVSGVAGDDVVGSILAIHRNVHAALEYTPGATAVGVDAETVLERGEGVCQDYAHVAVAVARRLGIPARYVSGYFFTANDSTGEEGDSDVAHVQTHAWFEAAISGYGWLAVDPTNALPIGTRHIKIAHGREYDDVSPLRGVFRGGSAVNVTADVEIRRSTAQQMQQQQQ